MATITSSTSSSTSSSHDDDKDVACKNSREQPTCRNELKTDVAESWYLHRVKNKVVLGVWDEDCSFQISLRYHDRPEDPLAVQLFNEAIIPYHCLPTCGVYGLSDYHIALPIMIVVLGDNGLTDMGFLCKVLPKQLQNWFAQEPVKDSGKLDVSLLIHSRPCFEESVEPSSRQVNVLFHMWALKDIPSTGLEEVHMTLEMGGFSPDGSVVEIPPICEAEELNGLPLGRTGPRILYMHDMRFSPHNAQVKLSPSCSLHALYTLCKHHNGHTALTYHILPSTQAVEDKIKLAVKSSSDLETFLKHFKTIEDSSSDSQLLTQSMASFLSLATRAP